MFRLASLIALLSVLATLGCAQTVRAAIAELAYRVIWRSMIANPSETELLVIRNRPIHVMRNQVAAFVTFGKKIELRFRDDGTIQGGSIGEFISPHRQVPLTLEEGEARGREFLRLFGKNVLEAKAESRTPLGTYTIQFHFRRLFKGHPSFRSDHVDVNLLTGDVRTFWLADPIRPSQDYGSPLRRSELSEIARRFAAEKFGGELEIIRAHEPAWNRVDPPMIDMYKGRAFHNLSKRTLEKLSEGQVLISIYVLRDFEPKPHTILVIVECCSGEVIFAGR